MNEATRLRWKIGKRILTSPPHTSSKWRPYVKLDPRSAGLALQLDDGTRKSHSVAENSAFVMGFIRGIAEKNAFAQLVADLYFVYQAMEDSFEQSEDANVRSLD